MFRLKKWALSLGAALGLAALLAPTLAPAQAPPRKPTTHTVEIRGDQYLIKGKDVLLNLNPGDRVVWWNRTATPHTATSMPSFDRSFTFKFDTGRIAPGAKSKAITFPGGDYMLGYRCQFGTKLFGAVKMGNGGPMP
jgi:hypothetical protein